VHRDKLGICKTQPTEPLLFINIFYVYASLCIRTSLPYRAVAGYVCGHLSDTACQHQDWETARLFQQYRQTARLPALSTLQDQLRRIDAVQELRIIHTAAFIRWHGKGSISKKHSFNADCLHGNNAGNNFRTNNNYRI